jgi:predicted PurR-regulated permease PerM
LTSSRSKGGSRRNAAGFKGAAAPTPRSGRLNEAVRAALAAFIPQRVDTPQMEPSHTRIRRVHGQAHAPANGPDTPPREESRVSGDRASHRPTALAPAIATSQDMARRFSVNLTLKQPWVYNALVIAAAAWILHGFVEAMLAASVFAIASWPLYLRFVNRVGHRLSRGVASLIFTSVMTVFVLAPMVFAFVALLTEAQALLSGIAAAGPGGIGAPGWLGDLPLVGSWLASGWERHLGALAERAEQADPTVLLAWFQQAGRFTAHHALVISFTVLMLFFLYRKGELIAEELRRVLRESFVDAERYLGVATRAVQGSLNSMVIVGLCDGLATTVAFALIGVPHAPLWGAIIGSLALIPFVAYVGVTVLAFQLTMKGAAALAFLSLGAGVAILLAGDKILRPVVARDKVALPFVWFLMGCLGGFEVLGVVGLVVGPVVLTIARELWEQRTR